MSRLDRKLAWEQSERVRSYRAEVERLFEGRGNCETLTQGGGGRKLKPVRNMDTGEIFSSVRLAARAMKLNNGAIFSAVHNGHRAGGYRWAYI